MDVYYHKPNWKESAKEGYELTFLDHPSILCLYRVIKRNIKYYDRTRSDMAKYCKESLDFFKFILLFNYNNNRINTKEKNKKI